MTYLSAGVGPVRWMEALGFYGLVLCFSGTTWAQSAAPSPPKGSAQTAAAPTTGAEATQPAETATPPATEAGTPPGENAPAAEASRPVSTEGDAGAAAPVPEPTKADTSAPLGDATETSPGPVTPRETVEASPGETATMITASLSTPAPVAPRPERKGPRNAFGLLGPGLSVGCFYPQQVNDYIEHWKDLNGVEIESGVTAIFYNLVPRATLILAPIEYVQFQVFGEIGWAPKFLAVSGGEGRNYHYMRYSGGATVNGHLPLKNGKYSVFLGGGALFNYLRFEDYSAWAPGARGLVGLRMYGEKVIPEIFIAFDYIRDDSDQKVPWIVPATDDAGDVITDENGNAIPSSESRTIKMDYTGLMIGANFYFQLFGE